MTADLNDLPCFDQNRHRAGAATELPNGQRINAIRPSIVAGSPSGALERFRGFRTVAAEDVALGYVRSIEGVQTGQIFEVT